MTPFNVCEAPSSAFAQKLRRDRSRPSPHLGVEKETKLARLWLTIAWNGTVRVDLGGRLNRNSFAPAGAFDLQTAGPTARAVGYLLALLRSLTAPWSLRTTAILAENFGVVETGGVSYCFNDFDPRS